MASPQETLAERQKRQQRLTQEANAGLPIYSDETTPNPEIAALTPTSAIPEAPSQEELDKKAIKSAAEQTVTIQGKQYQKSHLDYIDNRPFVKPEFRNLYYGSGFMYGSGEPGKTLGEDLSIYAARTMERLSAAGVGMVDFATDTLNKIPGVDLPKIPKFKSELAQTTRNLSSIIVPTLLLRNVGVGMGAAAQARVGSSLGNNRLVRFLGEAGVDAAAGVVVDSINELNEQDDNFQGTLKKSFPSWFWWISNDWATQDSDSPDVKRAKNINEGVGFSFLTALMEGSTTLLRNINKTNEALRFVPEDEKATTYFAKIKELKEKATKEGLDGLDPTEQAVLRSMQTQEDALDELGTYLASKEFEPTEPLLGYHDTFDIEEEGIRSVDPDGVIGATVDAARIQNNKGTVYGRLGNIISEAALKYGLEAGDVARKQIVDMVVENIRNAGKYSYEYVGGKVTQQEIADAGERLAEYLVDPRMDTGMLKATLDNFKNNVQRLSGTIQPLSEVGYSGTMKAIKQYMDDYANLDSFKARAYLTTSMAGQVSDMAEGARYVMDAPTAIARAQEQILDRIEYLMVEKGLASYTAGAGLANLKVWDRVAQAMNPAQAAEIAENARSKTDDALRNLLTRAKTTVNTLRTISEDRPEYLVPLQMAWEFTDGNIDSLAKLNNFVQQSLPAIHKAWLDNQPQIPNVLVQGMWSNIYNSVLTSISTPAKALLGNSALMLEKPFSVIGGAAIGMDVKTMRRGWYQYSAFLDTLQKGTQHMRFVFSKASSDPTSVGYIMRDDIARRNEATMDILHSFALAEESRGNSGPMALYLQAEALNDLSENPLLRFGANAMSALDGFTRAVIANTEARGRVWDNFIEGTKELNGKTYKEASDEIYSQMFDKTGMITDSAVDYASREIALNLDTPAVKAWGSFIEENPSIKPFFMFPRTSVNMFSIMDKHSPLYSFTKDINELALGKDNYTLDQMKTILETRGIPFDENAEQAFNTLRAEVRGRKAIGTIAVTLASGLFLNDRLHGDGHYDKTRQRVRDQLGWKKRSIKGLDGKWYSYDGLGPISDWMALTATVMDNMDTIAGNDLEVLLNKLGTVIGASITSKSTLAGAEPMFDVLSGNAAAINRWASSFTNSLVPLAGARNELGRIMSPALRETNDEMFELIRNRNRFMDAFQLPGKLPLAYDWIDGKPIGEPDSIWTRLWNATMPMKVSDGLSPERQFLVDVQYDARPTFQRNSEGVEYTPAERSELFNLMGQQGYFKAKLKEIMNSYDAKEWKKGIQERQRLGRPIDPNNWENLYYQIDLALADAKRLAEGSLSNRRDIDIRQVAEAEEEQAQRRGESLPILKNK